MTAQAVALPAAAGSVRAWHVPLGVRALFAILAALVAAQFQHDVLGLGGAGANDVFDTWLAVAAEVGAAVLCVTRGLLVRVERWAWLAFGAGIAASAIGDTIWGLVYAHDATTPVYSICDLFWLTWYPLLYLGFGLLRAGRRSGPGRPRSRPLASLDGRRALRR